MGYGELSIWAVVFSAVLCALWQDVFFSNWPRVPEREKLKNYQGCLTVVIAVATACLGKWAFGGLALHFAFLACVVFLATTEFFTRRYFRKKA